MGSSVKPHKNHVYLDNAGSVAYALKGSSITDGEPFNKVTSDFDKITVDAGRRASGKPAGFFKQDLGPSNMIGNNVNSDTSPSGLNFAIQGDLTMNVDAVTVTCPDIRFGQGSNDNGNNWWVGGSSCSDSGNGIACTCLAGASVKFQRGTDNDHFSVSIVNRCALVASREGYWAPVSAAEGETIGYAFSSSSTEYTEKDFMIEINAKLEAAIKFGNLSLSVNGSAAYVRQSTTSSSWSTTCQVTIPHGKRLWQWHFSVETNCGPNSLSSCYFQNFDIDVGAPCCLAGYQSTDPKVCTEAGKNMCTGL